MAGKGPEGRKCPALDYVGPGEQDRWSGLVWKRKARVDVRAQEEWEAMSVNSFGVAQVARDSFIFSGEHPSPSPPPHRAGL